MGSTAALARAGGFGQVALATGHLTDEPGRTPPRFPEHAVPDVEVRVEAALRSWQFGRGDLLINGGARGGDLIVATLALRAGATVWTLLAHSADVFARTSVEVAGASWVERYWHLLQRQPSWELGDEAQERDADPYAATNAWMVRVARTQSPRVPLRLLAVWDGATAAGAGGAGDMVATATSAGAEVTVIEPLRPSKDVIASG